MHHAVPPPVPRSLAVAGSDARFPVNRIFCVGRNYAAHAREMGADPTREAPFFFMKPAQAALDAAAPLALAYPSQTRELHHEIELVAAIGIGGFAIPVERALEHVYGYAVGLDMTRRDLQTEAKTKGRPWEFGKSFAGSAPIGRIRRAAEIGHPVRAAIALVVNGQTRQAADIDQMLWNVAACIAELSRYDPLEPGDLLMTGTPEGVAAVGPGDVLEGRIDGLDAIAVTIVAGTTPLG